MIFLAIISLIIASGWAYKTNFELEPVLAVIAAITAIIGFFVYENYAQKKNSGEKSDLENLPAYLNSPIININNNQSATLESISTHEKINAQNSLSEDEVIEHMKTRVKILFVDDDTEFNIVKILKDSGWLNTKAVTDLKGIDIKVVSDSDVLFIDNHGVGKLLNCKDEGLDLVQMIKEKYPKKVVVIYSADRQGDMFHRAITLANHRLAKNALPYEFQKIIQQAAINIYNNKHPNA